jgi:DNA-binding response OmpR family regulator
LEFNLRNEGYRVEIAHSGEEALKKLSDECSLVLLDVMMGGISGYTMAERLRTKNNPVPIIFLTAKDSENDMLTGFSVGGDDYISKPFSIKEVIVRIKAVLKRFHPSPSNESTKQKLIFNNLILDLETKELTIDGKKIGLTKTEFEILALLAKNPERMFSREHIIDQVWKDTPYIVDRTVDVHITRLRKKLGECASLIVNRSGYGYKLVISD